MDDPLNPEQYRPLLFGIAYRMLGSVMDAEDVVQEAYIRWHTATPADVRSPKAYLSTIVTHLCLDRLKSAQHQREVYIGPWLPEPLVSDENLEQVERADNLTYAFVVLLQSLSPVERAIFLLRSVFDYEYAEIAEIVGKSAANCRQIARRAQQHIAAHRPRFSVAAEDQHRLTHQFLRSIATGDMDGLLALLSHDITVYSDGGGKVFAARKPVIGRDLVARFLIGFPKRGPATAVIRDAIINGAPGTVVYDGGQPILALALDIADGQIRQLYFVANPDKLRHIPSLPDSPT